MSPLGRELPLRLRQEWVESGHELNRKTNGRCILLGVSPPRPRLRYETWCNNPYLSLERRLVGPFCKGIRLLTGFGFGDSFMDLGYQEARLQRAEVDEAMCRSPILSSIPL
jgi:hypothetical protein